MQMQMEENPRCGLQIISFLCLCRLLLHGGVVPAGCSHGADSSRRPRGRGGIHYTNTAMFFFFLSLEPLGNLPFAAWSNRRLARPLDPSKSQLVSIARRQQGGERKRDRERRLHLFVCSIGTQQQRAALGDARRRRMEQQRDVTHLESRIRFP